MCFQSCKDHNWSNLSVQLMELFKESNQTSSVGRSFFFKKSPRKTEDIKNHWYRSPIRRSGMHKKHTSPKNFQGYQAASAFLLPSVLQRCFLQSLSDVAGGVTLGSTWQRPLGGFHFFIGYQRSRPSWRRWEGKKWSSPYTLILQIGSMDDTYIRMF